MNAFRQAAREKLNVLLGRAGFQLVRNGNRSHITSFQPLSRTLQEADRAGLSVGDYIDQKFQVPGATQSTIDQLAALGLLTKDVRTVCEIGPGSGRYLEKVQRLCAPRSYEIYETDKDWSDWLTRRYQVTAHAADGSTLQSTANDSIDLGHAHKVFVYLPFVVACQYFLELIRVARKGGWITFDVVSESCMSDAMIEKWIERKIYYPCMMPRSFVIDFFARRGCHLRASFFAPMVPGVSEYLVFAKDGR
jgi:hypothetical protein